MRQMAKERDMGILEFSKYAEKEPDIDREIDERQAMLAKDGDCVIDGRLSRHFLEPDISIFLIAKAKTRAQRVVGRGEKYASLREAQKKMNARDESERKRYMDFYGIDLSDTSVYDLVISTDRFGEDETCELAHKAVKLLL